MKQTRFKHPILAGVIVTLIAASVLFYVGYGTEFRDFWSPSRFVEIIRTSGPLGPVLYIIMQIAQVIIAPLPGSIMAIAAGFVYGTLIATLLSMIGSTIGFLIIFLLAKRFGRPLARRFILQKNINRFDRVIKRRGVLPIYLAFLLPILPDPVVGFVAGLTPLRISQLMIIVVIARLPGVFVASYIGSQAAIENYTRLIIIVGAMLAASILLYVYRKPLEARFFSDTTNKSTRS